MANITSKLDNGSQIVLSQSNTLFQQFFQIQKDVGAAGSDLFYGIITIFYRNQTKEQVRTQVATLKGDFVTDDPTLLYQLSHWQNDNSGTMLFVVKVHYINQTEVEQVRVEFNYIFNHQTEREVYFSDIWFDHRPTPTTGPGNASSSDGERIIDDQSGNNYASINVAPIATLGVLCPTFVIVIVLLIVLIYKMVSSRNSGMPNSPENPNIELPRPTTSTPCRNLSNDFNNTTTTETDLVSVT